MYTVNLKLYTEGAGFKRLAHTKPRVSRKNLPTVLKLKVYRNVTVWITAMKSDDID